VHHGIESSGVGPFVRGAILDYSWAGSDSGKGARAGPVFFGESDRSQSLSYLFTASIMEFLPCTSAMALDWHVHPA
jgi:hypothetical protein